MAAYNRFLQGYYISNIIIILSYQFIRKYFLAQNDFSRSKLGGELELFKMVLCHSELVLRLHHDTFIEQTCVHAGKTISVALGHRFVSQVFQKTEFGWVFCGRLFLL
jgi:hypothetical protein